MNPFYLPVAARAGLKCEYCRAPQKVINARFEVEHIIPRASGGLDSIENFALACHSCNKHKWRFVSGLDEETEKVVRLFHPRRQRWNDHFSVDAGAGKVTGKTSIGRVTVKRLNMNGNIQTQARLSWIKSGNFS